MVFRPKSNDDGGNGNGGDGGGGGSFDSFASFLHYQKFSGSGGGVQFGRWEQGAVRRAGGADAAEASARGGSVRRGKSLSESDGGSVRRGKSLSESWLPAPSFARNSRFAESPSSSPPSSPGLDDGGGHDGDGESMGGASVKFGERRLAEKMQEGDLEEMLMRISNSPSPRQDKHRHVFSRSASG